MAKRYCKQQSLRRSLQRGNKIVVKSPSSESGIAVLKATKRNKSEFMHKHRKERAKDQEQIIKDITVDPITKTDE